LTGRFRPRFRQLEAEDLAERTPALGDVDRCLDPDIGAERGLNQPSDVGRTT